jgi:hypothetical protein
MIIACDPAVLSTMFSDTCTVWPDINAISDALTTLAMSCASAQCRMCIRDGQGHYRAGYLCARDALHAHDTHAMKGFAVRETTLLK